MHKTLPKEDRLKPAQSLQAQTTHTQDRKPLPIWRILSWLIAAIVGLISFIVLLYVDILPSISIEPDQLRDPKNPFSAPFKISNNGLVPAIDPLYSCHVTNTIQVEGVMIGDSHSVMSLHQKKIGSGETETITCPVSFNSEINHLFMSVTVCYKLPFISHVFQRPQWFKGSRDMSGAFFFDHTLPPEFDGPKREITSKSNINMPNCG